MIRRPPRSTQSRSSAASDVYKRQEVVRPARLVVVTPALAAQVAQAVKVRELEHRVERQLRLERLLQVRQRPVGELRRRPWVRARDLEAHHDTLEEAGVQILLARVLQVRGPH